MNDDLATIDAVIAHYTSGYGLYKAGTGTLVLGGVNTYNGATTVSAGKLVGVVGGNCDSSAVTVDTTLGVNTTDNTKDWSCKSLTFSSGSGRALEFNFGGVTPSTTTAPLQIVNGNLAFTSTPAVTIVTSSTFSLAGTYPLMSYSGSLTGTAPTSVTWANLDSTLTATLSHDSANKVVNLVVASSCSPPDAPTDGSATADSTTQITWGWTQPSGTGITYNGYTNASGGTARWTSGADVASYQEGSLSANTQYTCHVASYKDCESTSRLELPAKYTLANVPGVPTVDNPQDGSLDVNPAAMTPAGTLLAITVGGGDFTLGTHWVQADGSVGAGKVWQDEATWDTTTVTGLTNETQYTFKVRAKNGDGVETDDGEGASGTPSSQCEPVTAAMPTGTLTVCAGSTTELTETPSDGTAPYDYQWQICTGDCEEEGNWADCEEDVDGDNVTSATMTTMSTATNGTQYRCVVMNCEGSETDTSPAVTLTVNDVPSTPTAADATDVGDDTITWNWTAGSGATSYKLWDAATGGNQIGGTIANTYYVESGLDFNTEYSRWVEAINDCGASSRVALEATSTLRRDCVANNGFEAEFTNLPPKWELWDITTAGELSKLTSGAYAGSQAVGTPFPSTGSVYKGIYQQFNVTQGWYYNVQAYAKSTVSGGGQAWLGVNTDGSTTGGGNVAKTWPPGTSWSYRDALTGYGAAGNFAAQADVMTIILRSTRQTGSVGGTMYWDNVILSPAIKGLAGMPSDQSVCVGDPAPSFSVDADGAVGYQWEVNDGTGWVEVTDGSGATSATYTTATPTKDMDGWMYRCKVMGDGFSGCNGGTVWSSGATLTVKDATVVTGQPQHKSVLLGAVDVQFSITATGEGSLSYQWQKFDGNWTALSDESGHISGAQTATLEIDNVVENDVGQYRCVVTGDCGGKESDPAELAIGPTVSKWYSVKTHGTTHWAYELPVSGNGLIEPRRGDLVVRVEFSEAVMAVSESGIQVSDVMVMDSASNSVTPSAVKFVDGNRAEVASSDWLEITVAEGSADMRKLTVTLADGAVCRTTNTNAVVAGGRTQQVWCLIGDVNQSGVVSTTDIAKVRDQLKPPTNGVVSGTTFLNDVNLSGSINIVDMALVRGRDSNALPE